MSDIQSGAQTPSNATAGDDGRLAGRVLHVARVCWLSLAAILLVLWLPGLPALLHVMQVPCSGFACQAMGFTADQLRALRAAGISPSAYAVVSLIFYCVDALVWLGVGLLIFLRRGDNLGMLLISFAIATNPLMASVGSLSVLALGPALMPLVGVLGVASDILFYAIFFLFPDGRFVPRWTRWVFAVGAVNVLLGTLLPPTFSGVAGIAQGLVTAGTYVVAFGAQIYRYRRVSTPRQRQQSKWAVFGLLVAGIGQFALVAYLGLVGGAVAYVVSNTFVPVAQLAIPLFIGIAILRSRLYEIDVIINRALVYGLLTGLLVAVYFGSVIGMQHLAGVVAGPQASTNPLIVVVSTLLIAALFTPLRRRIQRFIDHRFYRRKYDAAKTLAAFGASLRSEVELSALSAHLIAVVDETMQPSQVSLWLRASAGTARHDRSPGGARP